MAITKYSRIIANANSLPPGHSLVIPCTSFSQMESTRIAMFRNQSTKKLNSQLSISRNYSKPLGYHVTLTMQQITTSTVKYMKHPDI